MTRTKMIAALAVSAAAGFATTANAGSTLQNETFTYANGNLVGNGAWSAHSGAGAMPVQVTGGAAVLTHGSGSREDVNLPLGSTLAAGQTFYAGFDFTSTGDATSVYFAHFMSTATTFTGRAFITGPIAGGDYTIGISDTSSISATWGTDLSFGTTYRAIISYDFDTRVSRLWINAIAEGDTSIAGAAGAASLAVNAFGLRQSAGGSTQLIDNLIIGDSFGAVVPAPGALALLGLSGLVAARRRRA